MSAPDGIEPEIAATPRGAAYLGRVDQAIEAAERQIEEQEVLIGDAAPEIFELQKMQLLVAILREGRERLVERVSD